MSVIEGRVLPSSIALNKQPLMDEFNTNEFGMLATDIMVVGFPQRDPTLLRCILRVQRTNPNEVVAVAFDVGIAHLKEIGALVSD